MALPAGSRPTNRAGRQSNVSPHSSDAHTSIVRAGPGAAPTMASTAAAAIREHRWAATSWQWITGAAATRGMGLATASFGWALAVVTAIGSTVCPLSARPEIAPKNATEMTVAMTATERPERRRVASDRPDSLRSSFPPPARACPREVVRSTCRDGAGASRAPSPRRSVRRRASCCCRRASRRSALPQGPRRARRQGLVGR